MNPISDKLRRHQILLWAAGLLAALALATWAVGAEPAGKLLDAVTNLVKVLIWPAAIIYLLVRFAPNVADFITTISEITFKGAGIEASLKRRQEEAAQALTAATISAHKEALTSPEQKAAPEAIAKVAVETVEAAVKSGAEAAQVTQRVSSGTIREIEGSKVLWVDDRPGNNNNERQALQAVGVRIDIATSTDEALSKLKTQKFDAILSDMGRPPDPMAGYTLLDSLRSSGDQTPYIIYAGSRSPEHQAEARRRGAIGCTNSPTELFQMVLSVLQNRKKFS